MKKGLIVVIAVLVVIGVGAYLLLTGKTKLTGGNLDAVKTSDVFTGSIKMAVQKGIPLKCTTPKDAATGIEVVAGYLKGEKYYGEINSSGKTAYIIMAEKCMYNWEKGAKQGIKLCFEENLWDQESVANASYTCVPAIVADSLFTPPSDVEFMDLTQTGGAIPGGTIPE